MSRFQVCERCGKKGVYEIHGWTMHPSGTLRCRYCYTYYPPRFPPEAPTGSQEAAECVGVGDHRPAKLDAGIGPGGST